MSKIRDSPAVILSKFNGSRLDRQVESAQSCYMTHLSNWEVQIVLKLHETESSGWKSKLDGPKRKYGMVFSTSGYLNWYFMIQLVGIQVFYESIYLNYLFIWINFINIISFLIIINWINFSTYVNIQFSAIFSVLRVLFLLVLRCSYVD